MADYSERALLPEGFHDDLPPAAEREASLVSRLLDRFAAFGYDRVTPPLAEFEDSLLSGSGKTQARAMFRVMDPVTHRMMGLRTDMTIQVARIAATRLAAEARPLRLAYAGEVLRVRCGQLRPERQFGQAGIELIGEPSLEADLEVLLIAADALSAIGLENLSVDLTVPTLALLLAAHFDLSKAATKTLQAALNDKDAGELAALKGPAGDVFRGLLAAAGTVEEALAALQRLALPEEAQSLIADLKTLVARLKDAAPGLAVTIDPGEFEGFEYKTGISFTLFAKGARGEIGRGGRYEITAAEGRGRESAIGFTVYLDSVIRAAPAAAAREKVYVPFGASLAEVRRLQQEGWRTVRGLASEADVRRQAAALGCSHILADGGVQAIA